MLYSGGFLGPPGPVSPWKRKQKPLERQTPSFPVSTSLAAGNSPITGRLSPLYRDSKGPETSCQDGTVGSCFESHLHALNSEQ